MNYTSFKWITHDSHNLNSSELPDNIILLFQPPACPEVNPRVRASQSCLTKALENLHHIVIVHRSPFDFLSQATLESCLLVERIQRQPSYQSEVLRTV